MNEQNRHIGALGTSGFEHDRDGTIIDKFNLHTCPENSGGYLIRTNSRADSGHKRLIEPLCPVRFSGSNKTRAIPFTGIAVEGKLADNEYLMSEVLNREVHFPRLVLKYAKLDHLLNELVQHCLIVRVRESDKREETGRDLAYDLAIDTHTCVVHPL